MTNQTDTTREAAWKQISGFEGIRNRFYRDGKDVPTIGAGYTPVSWDRGI